MSKTKFHRGRLSHQATTFLQSLEERNVNQIRDLFYDRFGINLSDKQIIKNCSNVNVDNIPERETKKALFTIINDGEISVDNNIVKIISTDGQESYISSELFTAEVIVKIKEQTINRLQEQLRLLNEIKKV